MYREFSGFVKEIQTVSGDEAVDMPARLCYHYGAMDRRSALHIRMLSSISAALKHELDSHWSTATQTLMFKDTYAFLQRLKPWHVAFVQPTCRSL